MAEPSTSSSSVKLYCPIEQTLTITEEKLKEMAAPSDDENMTETSVFKSEIKEVAAMPEIKFHLRLYCDGNIVNENTFMWSFALHNENRESRIRAKFSLFVKSANYIPHHDVLFDKNTTVWGDEICTCEEFFDPKRKFIVDGNFSVQIKGIFIIEVDELPKVIQMEASPLVQQLWKSDDKDFNIIVGNEGNVMVHKSVLVSPYFEGMFRSGREEEKTNTLKIIDFHLRTVQLAVEFLYDRHIFEDLNLDDAFELFRFADKYVIDDLEDKLITHISYRISPSTICGLVNCAIASNSIKLRQFCFDFMMICLRHTIRVDDLDILDKEFAAELFQKSLSSSFD